MRIRDTYADGINFANGTRNSTVYNSSFRNTGDDALAVWSSKYVKDTSVDIGHDNHFRNNTVQLLLSGPTALPSTAATATPSSATPSPT